MTAPPPPPPGPARPTPDDAPDAALETALEALAAGELGEAEARALRAHVAAAPAVAAAWDRIEAVERTLRAEGPLPAPVGLEARVLARVRAAAPAPRRASIGRVLGRVAAAVLVVAGGWIALPGGTQAVAGWREAPAWVARTREAVPTDVLPGVLAAQAEPAVTVAREQAPAMLTIVVGVVVLAAGLAILTHWHRRAARGAPA